MTKMNRGKSNKKNPLIFYNERKKSKVKTNL